MTSKRTRTQAARIVIAEDEVDKLKAILWPEHLYLREWHFNVGWGTSPRGKSMKPHTHHNDIVLCIPRRPLCATTPAIQPSDQHVRMHLIIAHLNINSLRY